MQRVDALIAGAILPRNWIASLSIRFGCGDAGCQPAQRRFGYRETEQPFAGKDSTMRFKTMILAAAVCTLAGPASAAEHVVKMLNKGAAGMMVFEPALVKAAPGDTVRFVPTDPSHNAESIPGMLPAGATPFKGKMNKEVTLAVSKPGVYGYKCLPHYGMGMVGLIVVGDPVNLDEAAKVSHPGKAKQAFARLIAAAR